MPARSILLLHAHPAPLRSRANRALLAAAESVPDVIIRSLYEIYPDFLIDVPLEQRLLEQHPVIILQHPFYWYSAPSLVKEWMDLVLQYGWAYGPGGTALHGKILLQAVTCGGPADVYRPSGRNRHRVRDFLLPFEQSARLCGMIYPAPFIVHGAGAFQEPDALLKHARDYVAVLRGLRDGSLDITAALAADWINPDPSTRIDLPSPTP
jgi:glutathione-regulated potassium-efflux system ancillary protein KefG